MHKTTDNQTLLDITLNSKSNSICDEFTVISGYLSPDHIQQYAEKSINTNIYCGMANKALNKNLIQRLKNLIQSNRKTLKN